MQRILVTGGAGFIGANFLLLNASPASQDAICVDSLACAGSMMNKRSLAVRNNIIFYKKNINDTSFIENILRKHRINCIVHFAAESHVDHSIANPDVFLHTNIMGTHSLLKAAKKVWLDGQQIIPHRFHHVSTDEVFGALSFGAASLDESAPYAPSSPYAASKAASDHLVRSYFQTYGLQVTTSHCSNNYGAYQFPEKLIPLCITHLLQDKKIPIYGDGLQIRDWLFVDDHVRAIALILKNGRVGQTYNIGGNNEITNIDIVKLIIQLLEEMFAAQGALSEQYPQAIHLKKGKGRELIDYVEDRPGHDRRYAINASKITSELGYKPQESFEIGMKKTLRWYLGNQIWWRAILEKKCSLSK